MIHEANKNIKKEIETIKRNQIEILENINFYKILEGLISKLDQTDE